MNNRGIILILNITYKVMHTQRQQLQLEGSSLTVSGIWIKTCNGWVSAWAIDISSGSVIELT